MTDPPARSHVAGPIGVSPFEVVPVTSWRKYPGEVNRRIGEINSEHFIFRGQHDSKYSLESSFDRKFGHLTPRRRRHVEVRIEELFQSVADRAEIEIVGADHGRASLAQHFGLATRMLDWTESRYVAAFFAYSGLQNRFKTSLEAEEAPTDQCVSVYALDVRSPLWQAETVEVIRGAPAAKNERLHRQRGLFTINRTQFTSLEEFIRDYSEHFEDELDRTALYRFDLPVQSARKALRDMQEMRISHSELFPGLDGVAREAMLREWTNNT